MTLAGLQAGARLIGVEAVVAGIGEFAKDIGEMNRLVELFGKKAKDSSGDVNIFEKALGFVGSALQRVGEIVSGILIARLFEKIVGGIRDIAAAAFDAASEFQNLLIRLEGLTAQELVSTGQVADFGDALSQAVGPSKDLFFWIQKLALTTPFDIMDVANTVTLAKSYGFTTDKAKELTSAIIDFSSGMGLSDIQMQRIIENFGQMVQQGKVTGTELRDLGRGAFVPVNDILTRMRENLGLTTDEFDKLRKEGLTETDAFFEAFIQLVGERFPNAGKRASQTLTAILGNLKDLAQGVLSFNIIRPVLDVFTGTFSEFISALTEGPAGESLIRISEQIGSTLADIAQSFVSFLDIDPSAIAGKILDFLADFASKLAGAGEIIKGFFEGDIGLGSAIQQIVEIFAGEQTSSAFGTFLEWLGKITTKLFEFKDLVTTAFDAFQGGGIIAALTAINAPDSIINFVMSLQEGFENIQAWWAIHGDQIIGLFQDIFKAIGDFAVTNGETLLKFFGDLFVAFTEGLGTGQVTALQNLLGFIQGITPSLTKLIDFIAANPEAIAKIIELWLAFRLAKEITVPTAILLLLAALGEFLSLLGPASTSLQQVKELFLALAAFAGGNFATDWAQFAEWGSNIGAKLWEGLGSMLSWITNVGIPNVISNIPIIIGNALAVLGSIGYNAIANLWTGFSNMFINIYNALGGTVGYINSIIQNVLSNLYSVGWNAIIGFWNGFVNAFYRYLSYSNIYNLFRPFINWIKSILGIASPSKLFAEIGNQVMQGFAEGIIEGIKMPRSAMEMAVNQTIAAALPPTVSNNVTTTNNFKLADTMITGARAEPILADFNQLQSLASLQS